jgi:predicted nucleic acid-binding Zn ribbon protein
LTMNDTRRTCQSCRNPIPPDARSDARTCSPRCRKALNRAEKAAKTRAETALRAARAPANVPRRDVPVTPRPAAEEITEQVRSQWEDRYWNRGPQW